MTIKLVKITKDNYNDAVLLKAGKDDNHFVASNVFSIAQAQFIPGIDCYGIYDDDLMVGFSMHGIREEFDEDDTEPEKRFNIWRFMIARNQRCKGYGKKALQLIIEQAVSLNQSAIVLDTGVENYKSRGLYESMGFKATSKNDMILILKDDIDNNESDLGKSETEIEVKLGKINLTTAELEQFCGLYSSEEKNMFRKIYLKDDNQLYWQNDEGELKLIPVAKNDLMFFGFSSYLLKFEFDGDTKRIQLFEDDECTAKYSSYELIDLSSAELAKYTGSYFCKELDVTYQLKLDSDKLIFMIKNKTVSQIQPTKNDQLLVEEWDCFFSFVYNEQKEIIGLKSDEDRAKNFEFVKI